MDENKIEVGDLVYHTEGYIAIIMKVSYSGGYCRGHWIDSDDKNFNYKKVLDERLDHPRIVQIENVQIVKKGFYKNQFITE